MKTSHIIPIFAVAIAAQDNFSDLGKTPVPFGPKPSGCSTFEVLVARGTSEPGPFGIIVGDPLVANITKAVQGSRGYAVQYPADASNSSESIGANDIFDRLLNQSRLCATQQFVLVGYSQGASVMHRGVANVSANIQDRILAVVMFGDPGLKRNEPPFSSKLQAKLWENCAPGDPVCGPGSVNSTAGFAAHITYNDPGTSYQTDSTNFVVAALQGKNPAPQPSPSGSGNGTATATSSATNGAGTSASRTGTAAQGTATSMGTVAVVDSSSKLCLVLALSALVFWL